MIFLIISVFFCLLGFVPDLYVAVMNHDFYWLCKILPWLVSIIFLGVTIGQHYEFIKRYSRKHESIEKNKQDKIIYQNQADELLGEFKAYLLEIYPEIEKTIFESMRPEKVSAYMIKYPELKSSETISKLVTLINEKKSWIYNCDLKIQKLKRDLRVMNVTGKWVSLKR